MGAWHAPLATIVLSLIMRPPRDSPGRCGAPEVARALRAALNNVGTVAPPDRRPELDHPARLRTAAAEYEYKSAPDARAALVADVLGIGSGSDVVRHDV